MIKCYHARRVELVVDTEPQLFYDGPMISPLIATIDSDNESLEDIWDCCNNSCWWGRKDFRRMRNYKNKFRVKFTEEYSGYCNDDLIVEIDGYYHVAQSFGWRQCNSFESALRYCREHSLWCQIHCKNHQHPTGKEHTMDELEYFKKFYENNGKKVYIIRDAR